MAIKEYNNRTGRQVKGMHCFNCDEDEVMPSIKQTHTPPIIPYVEFKCNACGDRIRLIIRREDMNYETPKRS